MPLLVMKFGGTSVADLARIENAARKVQAEVARGYDVIVIVSAMSGKTNELVGWVEGTSKLYDAREYDAVVASGENVTAGLMALRLQEMGIPARSWQGWQVPINTTSAHGAARFVSIPRENIDAKFAEGFKVAVVAGFQGVSAEGRITTLGRGGSDYSAAIFGVALAAEEVWIWTDVDGVMSADPRVTRDARTLPALSFREISELAFFGAKVLHPKTIRPVVERGIGLWVKNTFNPLHPGTRILPDNGTAPGSIKAVWAAWDQPALGALQAIEDAGRSNEGIVITGIDANPQAREAIAAGGNFEASVAQDFAGIGAAAADAVARVLAGEEILQSVTYVPTRLITAANADE